MKEPKNSTPPPDPEPDMEMALIGLSLGNLMWWVVNQPVKGSR